MEQDEENVETLDINDEHNTNQDPDSQSESTPNNPDVSDPDVVAGSRFRQMASGIKSGLTSGKDSKNQFDDNKIEKQTNNVEKDSISNDSTTSPNNENKNTSENNVQLNNKKNTPATYRSNKSNLVTNNKNDANSNNPLKSDPHKPNSVNTKEKQLNDKNENMRNKAQSDNRIGNKFGKKKINELAFRKTVANKIPGVGPILDTPIGDKPIEEARNASNPASAVVKGTKELVNVVKKITTIKSSIILVPTIVIVLLVVGVATGVTSKFVDGHMYVGAVNWDSGGASAVDDKYKPFYESVDQYGGSNKAMVVAVLTGYKSKDSYTAVCSEEDIEAGAEECIDEEDQGSSTSVSKMRNYIKMVAQAISDSDGDVTKGDSNDPENTGSKFYRWLYTDFIADYYSEYMPIEESEKKKRYYT